MTLSDIANTLEGYAKEAWALVETEAVKIEQEIEPVVESAFATAVQQFGALASHTITNLMTAAYNSMSGGEKLNLTVTTIVDAAEKSCASIAEADATALAKAAYTAVMGTAPAQ